MGWKYIEKKCTPQHLFVAVSTEHAWLPSTRANIDVHPRSLQDVQLNERQSAQNHLGVAAISDKLLKNVWVKNSSA